MAVGNRPGRGIGIQAEMDDYVVVDLETTGFSPAKDDIIELGALRVRNGEVVDKFHSMVNIDRPIPPWIVKKVNINNRMLLSSPYLPQVLPQFMSFLGEDIVLGHNVSFDVNFLYDKWEDIYARTFGNHFMDYMKMAKRLYTLPNYQLSTVAGHLGVDASGAHRAVDDCLIVHQCYSRSLGR